MNKQIIPCARCGCKENMKFDGSTPISAIIRTHDVCDNCFDEVKKDDIRLVREGRDIPQSILTEEDKINTKITGGILWRI